jgi:endonuclease III related protein
MNKILGLYKELLARHDYQGWWPINKEYRPKDYTTPRNENERYEIILGTILTQNTSWKNAGKALESLREKNLVNPSKILSISEKELSIAIRSAGYYNQKARYMKEVTKLYISLKGRTPTAKELLGVKGVGRETCDSILLYAYKKPVFVVDKYTERLLLRKKMIREKKPYSEIQKIFEENLPRNYKVFNEYHALIVAEMKK